MAANKPAKGRQKTSKRRIESAEKRLKALDLRKAGMSYRQMAGHLGVSPSMAHRYVLQALEMLDSDAKDKADLIRKLELERLDRMLEGFWDKASDGGYYEAKRVLEIMERRARLLGLDAPEKHKLLGDVDDPVSIYLPENNRDTTQG